MIKFSVVMPVYNAQDSLNKSIGSLINQSYKEWELIAVDDGSTDESLKILKELANKDNRIKVYTKQNGGPGSARNFGIKHCNGDYIAFLDSDDYFEKDYFEIVNLKINSQKNVDIVFIGRILEKENGKITNINDVSKYKKYTKNELISLQMMGILPWGPCIKLGKSKIVKECLFSDLDVGEELIYSFELLKKSKNIIFIDNKLYHYVYNDNGQHKKGGNDPWWEVSKKMKDYLILNHEYKKYEKSINGLAIRSLTIAIYRSCCESKFREAKLKIKELVNKYSKEFNINEYNNLMDKKTKIIMFFIKIKLYYIVYLASKYKSKK